MTVADPIVELVEFTANLLGRPLGCDHAAFVRALPALSELMRKGVPRWDEGPGDWQVWDARFPVRKAYIERLGSAKVVDVILKRRVKFALALLARMDAGFRSWHPDADPAGWRLVILRGPMFRETFVDAGRFVVVHMDVTARFDPRSTDAQPRNVSP